MPIAEWPTLPSVKPGCWPFKGAQAVATGLADKTAFFGAALASLSTGETIPAQNGMLGGGVSFRGPNEPAPQ